MDSIKQKTLLNIFEKTKELLEKGFTQDEMARDANFLPVSGFSDKACYFCLYGAIMRAHVDSPNYMDLAEVIQYFKDVTGVNRLVSFNDRSDKHTVLHEVERTIGKLKREE